MILTMAYLLLVAVLICVAALLGERLCAELGWPRRSAWLLALLASVALPAYTIIFAATDTAGTPILSLPLVLDVIPAFNAADIETVGAGTAGTTSFSWSSLSSLSWPDWQAFNSAFLALWLVSSVAMLLFYLLAALRLGRIMRTSHAVSIGDQEILLSDSLGPAVLGLLSPRIVLPRWLAVQETGLRNLVLSHEREHIAARDHVTLFAALLLVALMPWNIALWWQLRRLRAAIEVDCDSRVLREGADAHDYSEALLTVGQQSMRTPFACVALTEPVSELEKRIRIMMEKARKFSIAGFGGRSVLVAAVIGLAIAVNAPNAQQPGDRGGAADGNKAIPTISVSVFDQLSAAQVCLDDDNPGCANELLNILSERRDLNVYETAQLQNFFAFLHFDQDNFTEAANAYENILALPHSEMPDGLIQSAMRNLSLLYIQDEQLTDGLAVYDQWLALPTITPSADDFYLKATLHYQLEEYEEALPVIERAIAESTEPKEQLYQLLYVLQYQNDDQEGSLRTLETLNERWPKEQWAKALDGAAAQQAALREASASTINTPRFDVPDGEYLPIVTVAPVYPSSAAAQRLEGYAVVSYTVNTRGTTENVEVVESSDPVFDDASIESAAKYKYRPRIEDGVAVAVDGVTTKIIFELGDAD